VFPKLEQMRLQIAPSVLTGTTVNLIVLEKDDKGSLTKCYLRDRERRDFLLWRD